jgi:hypothetical protein
MWCMSVHGGDLGWVIRTALFCGGGLRGHIFPDAGTGQASTSYSPALA